MKRKVALVLLTRQRANLWGRVHQTLQLHIRQHKEAKNNNKDERALLLHVSNMNGSDNTLPLNTLLLGITEN